MKNPSGGFDPTVEIRLIVTAGTVIIILFAILAYFAAR
jgi:hypothetical protein